MDVMKDGRVERDDLKATMEDLRGKIKERSEFDLNFFKGMEAESKEHDFMKK